MFQLLSEPGLMLRGAYSNGDPPRDSLGGEGVFLARVKDVPRIGDHKSRVNKRAVVSLVKDPCVDLYQPGWWVFSGGHGA